MDTYEKALRELLEEKIRLRIKIIKQESFLRNELQKIKSLKQSVRPRPGKRDRRRDEGEKL